MPSRNQYSPLPTTDPNSSSPRPSHDFNNFERYADEEDPVVARAQEAALRAKRQYERFHPPAPATWKRVSLVFFVVALFIIAWKMRVAPREEIIHADR